MLCLPTLPVKLSVIVYGVNSDEYLRRHPPLLLSNRQSCTKKSSQCLVRLRRRCCAPWLGDVVRWRKLQGPRSLHLPRGRGSNTPAGSVAPPATLSTTVRGTVCSLECHSSSGKLTWWRPGKRRSDEHLTV